MDQTLHLSGVIVLCALALAGTLLPVFEDTLTQRTGLVLIGIGAAAEAVTLLEAAGNSTNAHLLQVIGCAVYGVGTGLKTWHYRRKR